MQATTCLDVADAIAIDDVTLLREHDPATDLLTAVGDLQVVIRRSRFEVDFNRPRDRAVYAANCGERHTPFP
jgi:N-formylglutamate deformylase